MPCSAAFFADLAFAVSFEPVNDILLEHLQYPSLYSMAHALLEAAALPFVVLVVAIIPESKSKQSQMLDLL